jgi:hypothetical protein
MLLVRCAPGAQRHQDNRISGKASRAKCPVDRFFRPALVRRANACSENDDNARSYLLWLIASRLPRARAAISVKYLGLTWSKVSVLLDARPILNVQPFGLRLVCCEGLISSERHGLRIPRCPVAPDQPRRGRREVLHSRRIRVGRNAHCGVCRQAASIAPRAAARPVPGVCRRDVGRGATSDGQQLCERGKV